MRLPDYEYRGLMAQAWDVLRGDTSRWADRSFYLELIRQYGQPVLDIGCGTGRLTLDYLAQGVDIEGVDNSPEMLAICRQKAAELGLEPVLYEQFMEELHLPRQYRTILIPSSSIQLITDREQVERALGNIRAQLTTGGAVVASIMTLWKAGDPLESQEESSAVRESDGVIFRRVARARFSPESECEHTEDLYQMIVDGAVVAEQAHRRSPATRSYTQAQARALFERAGFENVRLCSEFRLEAVKPEDTLFTVVGEKVGRA